MARLDHRGQLARHGRRDMDVHGVAGDNLQLGRWPLGRGSICLGRLLEPAASDADQSPTLMAIHIVSLRWRRRLGPAPITGELGLDVSTVHAVLAGCRINRLSRIDKVTGKPTRRYEHAPPGI